MQQIERLDSLTPDEAQARLAVLPMEMVYESRYGIQQAKESISDPNELAAVVEPLARCLGWAEALVFSQHQNVENIRALVSPSFGNGHTQPGR